MKWTFPRGAISWALLLGFISLPAVADDCPELVGPWPVGGEVTALAVSLPYAYVASGTMLLVADVSVPTSPQVVGGVPLEEMVSDAEISGRYLYLLGGGLRVMDLADPMTPIEVGFVELMGNLEAVAVSGNYAYVADSGWDSEGLLIVDVSDPASPVELEPLSLPSYPHDVVISGGYAYVVVHPQPQGLVVVDLSVPSSPERVAFLRTDGTPVRVAASDGLAYVSELGSSSSSTPYGLRVIDVSEPTSPASTGFWEAERSERLGSVSVSGTTVFALSSSSGLLVVDVSFPSYPDLVGFKRFQGSPGEVKVAGDHVYVTETDGLQVIDADPSGPVEVGSCSLPGWAVDVVTDGDYAYTANSVAGFRVVDVSDPTSPVEVGSEQTPGDAVAVDSEGDLAFVADGDGGLRIIDVSDPSSPIEVGVYDTSGRAEGVAVSGTTVLVAARDAGLLIVDVGDPANPEELGSYQPGENVEVVEVAAVGDYALILEEKDLAHKLLELKIIGLGDPSHPHVVAYLPLYWGEVGGRIAVSGDLAYVTYTTRYGSGYLAVIDVNDPGHPAFLGSCWVGTKAPGVSVSGSYALVAADYEGLQVVDVADPSSPTVVGFIDTIGRVRGVAASGDFAYVAAHNLGFRVLDIRQPHPMESGSIETPGSTQGIAAAGDYAYVAGDSGFRVFDLSTPTSPVQVGQTDAPGMRVAVSGDLAVVGDWFTLRLVDVSDPTTPEVVSVIDPDYNEIFWDFAIADSRVFISFARDDLILGGLLIFDVSDPSAPLEIGVFEYPGWPTGVDVVGSFAYLAGSYRDEPTGETLKDLMVVDVSNPAAPTEVGLFRSEIVDDRWFWRVVVSGSFACVGGDGFWLIDVSDPTSPIQTGFLPVGNDVPTMVGNYAFLVDGYEGVRVVDVSDPSSPLEVGFREIPGNPSEIAVYGNFLHVTSEAAGVHIINGSSCPGYHAPSPSPRRSGGRVAP